MLGYRIYINLVFKSKPMKRILYMLLLLAITTQLIKAQTTSISGTVKDQQGNPRHYIFVQDNTLKNVTYTDSLGNFSIMASPGALLGFNGLGYADTVINIGANTNLQVVLRAGSGQGGGTALSAHATTITTQPLSTAMTDVDMGTMTSGGLLPSIAHQKDGVQGNRYMFDTFAPGFVVTPAGEFIQNPHYRYDYDKIGGGLLMTEDNKAITELSDNNVKTITLFSNTDQRVELAKVPAIDNAHYVQVLSSGPKYAIYKAILCRLVKADFVNAGITTHGNNFDQYVDDITYYALDVQSNQLQKFSPKKKAIKAIFIKDADKVNKYINDNSGDIDDAYLQNLGAALNN